MNLGIRVVWDLESAENHSRISTQTDEILFLFYAFYMQDWNKLYFGWLLNQRKYKDKLNAIVYIDE